MIAANPPVVLILDEITNNLDLETKLPCGNDSVNDNYMFWNGTHLTEKSNEYLGDQLAKALDAS